MVAVLSTGNELRDLQDTTSSTSTNPSSHHFSGIVDSNRPTLISVLQHLHYEVIDLGICGDTMDETTAMLKRGKEQADVVITTGGTSMGVGDLLKPCIERELGGTVHFGRVAMKPGSVFFSLSRRTWACSTTSGTFFGGGLTHVWGTMTTSGNRPRSRPCPRIRWRRLGLGRSCLPCRATRRVRS